uniref:Pre-rRNA-processing protein TSR1 homolog n=1 Tax=Macrostomum lignano TaxID=282301 RepID=A0A1I8HED6_9PLAT
MRPNSKAASRHKPGAFKTVNKAHKSGRHKSNRGLKRLVAGGGRVSKTTSTSNSNNSAAKAARLRNLPKSEQRNRLKLIREASIAKAVGKTVEQLRELKKSSTKNSSVGKARKLSNAALGVGLVPPILVTFVCADSDLPCRLLQAMAQQGASGLPGVPGFQFRFVRPTESPASLLECLDLAKVSDSLVLTFQAGSEFTEQFQRVLSSLFAQGLPTQLYAAVLTAADTQRDRKAWEKAARADLEQHGFGLPADCGFLTVRDSQDLGALLRRISSRRLVTQLPQQQQLRMVTHIRGPGPVGLSTGDLLHLVGWGDYRLTGWTELTNEDDKVKFDQTQSGNEQEEAAVPPSQLEFPDEVDTPKDVPARERFSKYRLLNESASWDPWTDLPDAYANLVRFSNFVHARNRMVKQTKATASELTVGRRADLQLEPVTAESPQSMPSSAAPALVWYRMLEHENRLSLLNCSVRLNPSREQPLAADRNRPLLWQVGWRRFYSGPVLSESDNNSNSSIVGAGKASSVKLCLRHLLPGEHATASFYAPLTFTPAPVIAMSPDCQQQDRLLFSGSLESCDPARVVLKRVILSGQPFKIHKRSAVIRYLFFNPEDALYYRDAANLRTKHGRRGKIQEPVGTHGLCKCRFDGPVTNMDTVLVDLYKRQFPKLNYRPATC